MSEVDVLGSYDDLDRLLRNVQLEKPETNDGGNGNDGNVHVNSQASLFEAVWSPTDETPNGKAGLAPDEGRDRVRRQEGACVVLLQSQRKLLLKNVGGWRTR